MVVEGVGGRVHSGSVFVVDVVAFPLVVYRINGAAKEVSVDEKSWSGSRSGLSWPGPSGA